MTASVVAFCMPGAGHLQSLLPVVHTLCARGHTVHALTDARFRQPLERSGARFVDLFTAYPIAAADGDSLPRACRCVSFAGVYGERIAADVAALAPAAILYDTFAVIGPVVAQRLGIPSINVCAGHAVVPARAVAELRADPRVAISPACWAAVHRLQTVHHMPNANPFSYVEAVSPFLNLYGEPEEFLDAADRTAFEPLAFFGALAPDIHEQRDAPVFPTSSRRRRIYASFGTVAWWYYEAAAYAALQTLAATLAEEDVDVVISLGGHRLAPAARAALERPNVHVVDYVDQWAVLREADAFVTHHGLNSTHEAIFHTVPMLSYPFFSDQPALARRCQDLGLAVPLTRTLRGPLTRDGIRAALAQLFADAPRLTPRLREARAWELRTIAGRDAVVDRIEALLGAAPGIVPRQDTRPCPQ